jgi:hypothetical protein
MVEANHVRVKIEYCVLWNKVCMCCAPDSFDSTEVFRYKRSLLDSYSFGDYQTGVGETPSIYSPSPNNQIRECIPWRKRCIDENNELLLLYCCV